MKNSIINTTSSEVLTRTLSELQEHQIELEMQNEELLRMQEELRETKERYFDLYNMAPIGYCTLSSEGLIEEANLTTSKILDVERNTLIKAPIKHFILPEDQNIYSLFSKKFLAIPTSNLCELRMVKKDGTSFWVQIAFSMSKNSDNIEVLRLIMSDISFLKQRESQLENLAHYDSLTSLPNRVLLSDRLHQGMIQARRHHQSMVIAYLDLDGFKEVNDTYGHDVGDQLLIALATKMQQALREGDTLSRIGGDEFVVVLPELSTIEDSVPLLERLLSAASQQIHIGEHMVQVSASFGVTIFPQLEDVDADLLLRQADQAMYQAKLSGKNHYEFFNLKQNDMLIERYEAIKNIKKALAAEEFVLYYQPKVNMRTGAIIGLEALIRWQHPTKGFLNPLEFLPLIADHPLSIHLGEWVINTALIQIEQWQESGISLVVSVNISAYQLMKENFVKRLSSILSAHPKVNPALLEIEILEMSRLKNVFRSSEIMIACKKLGIVFSLDDFSTNYSSLTYLKQLPIKLIKIDQSFVKEMLHNSNDLAILEGIISLATAFGHEIIAEGVETIEHGELLLQMGCELAQGYAISPPMPSEEISPWVTSWVNPKIWETQTSKMKTDLPLLFATIEHQTWVDSVYSLLSGKYSFAESLDHTQCSLGKWLENEGFKRFGENRYYLDIKCLHYKIHHLASELIALYMQGENFKVSQRVGELHHLQDELSLLLKKLGEITKS